MKNPLFFVGVFVYLMWYSNFGEDKYPSLAPFNFMLIVGTFFYGFFNFAKGWTSNIEQLNKILGYNESTNEETEDNDNKR